jgi:hypothetical protein
MQTFSQTIRLGALVIACLAAKRQQEDRHSETLCRSIHESDLH